MVISRISKIMDIRPYQLGDEKHILKLFEVSFGKSMSLEFWQWRYKKNPFTRDLLIHMMWDKDVLVGHYAVSPVEMIVGGERKLTALSMTTMTHPSYAGRGIFSKLAESLYKEIRDTNNIEIVWGFPNNNSHYGFIKNLQWKDVVTIPFLTLKLKERPFEVPSFRVLSKFTSAEKATLISDRAHFQINKTADFLNWRYVDNPAFQYKVISLEGIHGELVIFKVIKSFNDPTAFEVDILDWSFQSSEQVKQLIDAIVSMCLSEGFTISQINTWESVFSPRHIMLEKTGFSISAPVTYLGARTLKGNNEVDDFRKWDIGMGYSDVF